MENSRILDSDTNKNVISKDINSSVSSEINDDNSLVQADENSIINDVDLKPEERIYVVATDKDNLDWKGFLYQLIHDEGLDPWNVDLGILTNRYLAAVKQMTNVDFDITGKFLTIAVFLLKTKAEHLVDKDLRGIDDQIAQVQIDESGEFGDWETLEELDSHLEDLERKRRRENYEIKVRNPIARKRKVNIFDLINLLEKTFKQSNKRKANFLQRNGDEFDDGGYDGPMYEENPMDLATIIDNLHNVILEQLQASDKHIHFSKFIKPEHSTLEVLENFLPLLYLHNQDKIYLKQKNHFDDIEIHHKDKVELPYNLNDFLEDEKIEVKKNKK